MYEHPRDADTDTILDQFQCRSSKATPSWLLGAIFAYSAYPFAIHEFVGVLKL